MFKSNGDFDLEWYQAVIERRLCWRKIRRPYEEEPGYQPTDPKKPNGRWWMRSVPGNTYDQTSTLLEEHQEKSVDGKWSKEEWKERLQYLRSNETTLPEVYSDDEIEDLPLNDEFVDRQRTRWVEENEFILRQQARHQQQLQQQINQLQQLQLQLNPQQQPKNNDADDDNDTADADDWIDDWVEESDPIFNFARSPEERAWVKQVTPPALPLKSRTDNVDDFLDWVKTMAAYEFEMISVGCPERLLDILERIRDAEINWDWTNLNKRKREEEESEENF